MATSRPTFETTDADARWAIARARIADLVRVLVDRELMMATGESLTGGLCAYLLVDEPDSGEVMLGSIVAYTLEQKQQLLGVEATEVVSDECASQMVTGTQRAFGATCAISFTGVAGPAEVEGKPAGTVHIGVACGDRHRAFEAHFDGDPDDVRLQAIAAAAEQLIALITGNS